MSENKTKKINFSEFKSLFDNFFRNKIKKTYSLIMSRKSQMTPVGEVSRQEDNLKANDKDLMEKKRITHVQSKVIKSNLASGNCLF